MLCGESPQAKHVVTAVVCSRMRKFKTLVVAMFSRYPRSVLRHELDCDGRNTLATTVLGPRRGVSNNAGMGSSATASRVAEIAPSASWEDVAAVEQGDVKFRAPGVRSLRGFTRLELQERLSKQRVTSKQDSKIPLPIKEAIKPSQTVGSGRSHRDDPQHRVAKLIVEVR